MPETTYYAYWIWRDGERPDEFGVPYLSLTPVTEEVLLPHGFQNICKVGRVVTEEATPDGR